MLVGKIFLWAKERLEKSLEAHIRSQFKFPSSVRLYNPLETKIKGNVSIEAGTYINSGRILTGKSSKIIIGRDCAIGHNVTLSSITHDIKNPTGPNIKHVELDIIIGDNVWIGSNVYIREGITIGDRCIVGANSVVTKSFGPDSIIGGVPARLLRKS